MRSVVVGASLAGLRAAESLRQRDPHGQVVLVGAEATLPYTRPPLSKQILSGEWEPERSLLRSQQDLAAMCIDLHLGSRATGVDLRRRTVAVQRDAGGAFELEFDRLVIATGASARRVAGLEGAGSRLFHLRTLDDAVALKAELDRSQRVLVVGGGFIGAEVASTARGRGLDVVLVEPQPVLLLRGLGPRLGRVCTSLHESRGVHVRCGVTVASATPAHGGLRVGLSDGSEVEVDCVVAGVGAEPSTDWLVGSGLALGNGVRCDEACRVLDERGQPVPGVVAAGDVARWRHPERGEIRLEHWTNAQEQASAAVATLLADEAGEPAAPFAPVTYVWSDQHGRKIQVVGEPPNEHGIRVVRGSEEEGVLLALVESEVGRLVGAVGIGMAGPLVKARQLLAGGASVEQAVRDLRE